MKNALKILILILSVALIIGALVMVTGAEEQQNGMVTMTLSGHTYDPMSLDDALTLVNTIQKQFNTTDKQNTKYTDSFGVEHTVGNMQPTIKLLGNVEHTKKYNHTEGGLGTSDAVNKTAFVYKVSIDLNGYDYKATTTNAFQLQFGNQHVEFKGEGSVGLPAGDFINLMSGAKLYVNGSGKGIRFYNLGALGYFVTAGGSSCAAYINKAQFDYDITNDQGYNVRFFNLGANGAFNVTDCSFDIDLAGAGMPGSALFEVSNGTINVSNTVIDFKTAMPFNNFKFINAYNNGTINLNNTDVKADMTAKEMNVGNRFIHATGNARVNIKNGNIQLDIALDTTATHNASGYYVFQIADTALITLDNTAVDADCSGAAVGGAGKKCVPVEGVAEGTYAFVAKNSKLICVSDHPTTMASAKATLKHEILMTKPLIITTSTTADTYFLNTYVSTTFRGIDGFGATTDAETSAAVGMITFDNSTYEWERKTYIATGVSTNFGARLFNNLSYVNFVGGSRIITNGTGWSKTGGGGETELTPSYKLGANGTNTLDGANNHTVDLAIGTRLSTNDHSVIDLPAGSKIIQDKIGDTECPYVVVSNDYVSPYVGNAMERGARYAGYYTNGNVIGGRTGVWQWMLPKADDTSYVVDVQANDKDTDYQTITMNGDGTVTLASSAYPIGLGGVLPFGGDAKVVVYHIEVMPASNSATSIPMALNYTGAKADGGTNGYFYSGITLNADGTANKGTVKPGVWNTITVVVDLTQQVSKNIFVYVNGDHVDSAKATQAAIKEIRFEAPKGTYPQGATIAFSNCVKKVYNADQVGDTFNADNFKNLLTYENMYSKHSVNALKVGPMVGNTPYATLEAALAAAKTAKGHVNIWADYTETQAVYTAGMVYTNGYTLTKTRDYTKNLIIKNNTAVYYPAGVEFCATKDVTYTWNVPGGTTSVVFQQGGVPFVDDRLNLTNKGKVFYNSGILYFGEEIQWTTVNPADYDNYADYAAALAGGATMPEVVDGDLVLYPVYSDADYSVTTKNVVYYYKLENDFGAEITQISKEISANYQKFEVVLYNNITVNSRWYGITDKWLRTDTYFDLNGWTVTVSSKQTFASVAANLRVYSSKPGGTLIHNWTTTNGNGDYPWAMDSTFSTAGGAGKIYFGSADGKDTTYGDNLTIMSPNFVSLGTTSDGEHVFVNGGTYVKMSTGGGGWFTLAAKTYTANLKNATFINASGVDGYNPAEQFFHLQNASTLNFINCDIITKDASASRAFGADKNSKTETYTFTNCRVSGVLELTGEEIDVIVVDDKTVANKIVGAQTPEGYVVAYTNNQFSAETVTYKFVRPVITANGTDFSKYVYYTNDPAFTAEDAYKIVVIPNFSMKAIPADEATEYTWVDFAGETVKSAAVKNGEDILDFVTVGALDDINGTVLNVVFTGWELDGTTFKPGKQVNVATNVVYTNLSLYMNFDINFYVPAEYYDYLDEDTKALLVGTVEIEGVTYYYAEPAEMDANEAFTTATLKVTLVEGGETKTLGYSTSVYKYLASTFAYEGLADADYELAYVITEYLADAYNYFTLVDNANGAETLAALAEANVAYAPAATAIPELEDVTLGDASGAVSIYVDLKSSPKFVIKANEDGVKVSMTGAGAHTLALGEEIELSTRVFDFDNDITVTKADGATGTYNLAKYLVAISGTDAALDNLAASFYNYVMYAEAFRPAGT